MIYNSLGTSEIKVSKLCLGNMTWGSQNTQNEANEFVSICLDHGVNFFDTAEMYPTTPKSQETQGLSEKILGNWIYNSKNRDKIIVATKVTGEGFKMIRNGEPISPKTIRTAIEQSLLNLNSDYIDLYQLHWANRGSYHFRNNWIYNPFKQNTSKEINDIYLILEELNLFPNNINNQKTFLFLNFDNNISEQILNSMSNLRYQGIICELYPSNVKIKKQLDYANKKNFDFVILIGEEEVKNDSFILKNMSSGEQNSYKIDTLEDQIKKLI